MYIQVRTDPGFGVHEDALIGSLRGNTQIYLFLNDRLGGKRHQVTYRTENPPAEIELYPYERVATQVFKIMDGPTQVADKAKGKWIRFDVDVGWLFWMRVVNGRAELKLALGTQATFGQILRHLQQLGQATISIELADAPNASTSEGRVFLWLIKNISGIVSTERAYHIDRRAIAGAIAWEALLNPKGSFTQELRTATGTARFSGPGKVHYRESLTPGASPGITAAIEIEQRARLPQRTEEERRQILATTPGALLYIGAIMRECSDIAARGGYYLDCDPPSLCTFYNSWDIHEVERLFSERRVPAALLPNEMGAWVNENIAFLEMAVGRPPVGFCKKARGY